jgi:hypothetical protein
MFSNHGTVCQATLRVFNRAVHGCPWLAATLLENRSVEIKSGENTSGMSDRKQPGR